jgi:hypothetical protein
MTGSVCGDCGHPTRWVITELGRRVELDPEPVPGGNVVRVLVDGHIRARVLGGGQLPAEEPAWRRHAATCTASPEHGKRQARLEPRCRVCLLPMDPDLTRLEQWTTHPACDPVEGANTVRAALANAHPEAS